MPRGGARPGAGRKKGPTAATKAKVDRIEKAAAAGLLPHEFLLAVSRGEQVGDYTPSFEDRMEAAKAAAPFFAPKLASVEVTKTTKRSLADYTTDELLALAADHLQGARKPEAGDGVVSGLH